MTTDLLFEQWDELADTKSWENVRSFIVKNSDKSSAFATFAILLYCDKKEGVEVNNKEINLALQKMYMHILIPSLLGLVNSGVLRQKAANILDRPIGEFDETDALDALKMNIEWSEVKAVEDETSSLEQIMQTVAKQIREVA